MLEDPLPGPGRALSPDIACLLRPDVATPHLTAASPARWHKGWCEEKPLLPLVPSGGAGLQGSQILNCAPPLLFGAVAETLFGLISRTREWGLGRAGAGISL